MPVSSLCRTRWCWKCALEVAISAADEWTMAAARRSRGNCHDMNMVIAVLLLLLLAAGLFFVSVLLSDIFGFCVVIRDS